MVRNLLNILYMFANEKSFNYDRVEVHCNELSG
jgi:hypothetical protein